jgi:Domain of unknown function (DUF4492)
MLHKKTLHVKLIAGKLIHFFGDGFRNMKVGKSLWTIVIIKLIIMFGVLKLFFFPNYLDTHFKDSQSKAAHVKSELIRNYK